MAAVETRRTGTLRVPIPLTSLGQELDTSPEAFGELRRSDELAHDMQALRDRMAEDGGLGDVGNRNALVRANGPLMRLLYGGRMLAFYERFLGGPVRHFDYTWLRVVRPGGATAAHYDIVFMGRGTTNLYTAWTPLGDIDLQLGGLMVLEGSHRIEELRHGYGRTDVDTYCENRFDGAWLAPDGTRNRPEAASGYISRDHPGLQERLGGRWLTAEYRAGDLLTFTMYTAHASIDNRTDRWRLSTDSRYQLASEPVDGRWIGPDPIGHGPNAARGVIC